MFYGWLWSRSPDTRGNGYAILYHSKDSSNRLTQTPENNRVIQNEEASVSQAEKYSASIFP